MAKSHQLTVAPRSFAEKAERHAHSFHQIVLPVAGLLEMRVGTSHGNIGHGRGVIVASGTVHSFRSPGTNRFIVLDLPTHSLLPERVIHQAGDAFFAMDPALDALVSYLAFEAAGGPMSGP